MKNDIQKIEFVLKEKVDGREITPATITLHQFNEFNRQVEEFVAGSDRIKLDDVHVLVDGGSYKLTVLLPLLLAAVLAPDLKALERQDSLGEIDPRRAEIIEKWQMRTKGNPDTRYVIRAPGMNVEPIELSIASDFRVGQIVPWVKVEKYLFGTVVDMGGARKANVHIRLEDSKQIIPISTSQGYLKDQEHNHLYHKILVRVEADQHYRTGQLRNLRLLSIEKYEPKYDEAALNRFAEAGKKAWKGIESASGWVEKLRGGK